MLDDLLGFIRLVVNIWIHVCQELLEDLQDKWLRDCEAHMITGICLIGKRTGISAECHTEVFRQMVQWFA